MKLRPNRAAVVQQEYTNMMTSIANQKERSHKSVVSSERLSKADRKKVRDLIFADKDLFLEKDDDNRYTKLEQV